MLWTIDVGRTDRQTNRRANGRTDHYRAKESGALNRFSEQHASHISFLQRNI